MQYQAVILRDTVNAPEVVLAYGMVELNRATVFLDRGKLAPEARVSQLVGRCCKQKDCQMFPDVSSFHHDTGRHGEALRSTGCFHKLTGQVLSHLKDAEVEVCAYEDFASTLQTKVRDGCKAPCSYLSD